jgi:hypothetical protein
VPRLDVPRPVGQQRVANADGGLRLSAAQRCGCAL